MQISRLLACWRFRFTWADGAIGSLFLGPLAKNAVSHTTSVYASMKTILEVERSRIGRFSSTSFVYCWQFNAGSKPVHTAPTVRHAIRRAKVTSSSTVNQYGKPAGAVSSATNVGSRSLTLIQSNAQVTIPTRKLWLIKTNRKSLEVTSDALLLIFLFLREEVYFTLLGMFFFKNLTNNRASEVWRKVRRLSLSPTDNKCLRNKFKKSLIALIFRAESTFPRRHFCSRRRITAGGLVRFGTDGFCLLCNFAWIFLSLVFTVYYEYDMHDKQK
jgi:hypothetical protein